MHWNYFLNGLESLRDNILASKLGIFLDISVFNSNGDPVSSNMKWWSAQMASRLVVANPGGHLIAPNYSPNGLESPRKIKLASKSGIFLNISRFTIYGDLVQFHIKCWFFWLELFSLVYFRQITSWSLLITPKNEPNFGFVPLNRQFLVIVIHVHKKTWWFVFRQYLHQIFTTFKK